MSVNLVSAFEYIISLQGREKTLERLPTTVQVKMANSNYFRNLAGLEETVVTGQEFIVSKRALDAVSFPTPKRGDVIFDVDLGEDTISEVKPLIIMGEIAGYRLRTS